MVILIGKIMINQWISGLGVPNLQTNHVITIFESNMDVKLYRGSRTTVVFTDFSTPNPTSPSLKTFRLRHVGGTQINY